MNSWVRFDAVTQTIYGLATQPFYNTTSSTANHTFLLQASDSNSLSVNTPISIIVSTDHLIRVSHLYRMQIRTDYTLFSREIDHTLWWAGNLTQYFNQTAEAVTVLSIERSELLPGIVITWSNNSINNINPPYTCPLAQIHDLFTLLRGEDLRASLNQYLISSVTLSLQGICEGFTTSTTTQSTSTSTTVSTTKVTTPTTTSTSTTTTPTSSTSTSTTTTSTTTPTTSELSFYCCNIMNWIFFPSDTDTSQTKYQSGFIIKIHSSLLLFVLF